MSIFRELQRRKVIRVGGVYFVVSWLLLQIAATIAPILSLPAWFESLVLALLAIGLPIALILAWAFELSPDGISRDSGAASTEQSRFLDYAILAAIGLGIVYLAVDAFRSPGTSPGVEIDRSIAVLPFANLTGDESNRAFAAGMHSDLLTQLFRIDSIRTVSRTTMLAYANSDKSIPQIASELNVATVLEAGVQRSGNTVRITVQLVNATDDVPMWNEVYDRELSAANVFAIQGEITTAISEQLRATLTGDDLRRIGSIPTENLAALDTYHVGRLMLEERTRESLQAAAEYFETVVELDPEFALGWSGLADAYMLLPEYSSSIDRAVVESRARESVLRALELDPDLPEVRATEAWYQLRFYDWDGAERIFREALDAAPDNINALHWLSHVLSFQGRHDEALTIARKAVAVEPQSRMMATNLAYILVDARQFDEALNVAWGGLESDPEYTVQRRNLFLHELRAGNVRDAASTFVAFVQATGGDRDAAEEIGNMFIAYAEHGEVGHISAELVRKTSLGSEDLAQVLAFVGDGEGTIAALQSAAAEHSGSRSVFSMKINPAYDFIRDDPRFVALLEEVGLAD